MTAPGHRDPAAIARHIMATAGTREPRIPVVAELDRLARAYLALVDRSTSPTTTPLYVSVAAAQQYAEHAGYGRGHIETARRELAELLLHARPSQTDPTLYRARRRSGGVDVSARVAYEGELLVVTTVAVRDR